MKKRLISIFLALVFMMSLMSSVIAAVPEADTFIDEEFGAVTYEETDDGGSLSGDNPLYPDVVLEKPSTSKKTKKAARKAATNNTETFNTVESAGAYLRAGMVDREATIIVPFDANKEINGKSATAQNEALKQIALDVLSEGFKHTGNGKEGDSLRWVYASWKVSWSETTTTGLYEYTYSLTYYTNLAQENEVDGLVQDVEDSFTFSKTTSDYEKVLTIYDFICDHVTYDYDHLGDSSYVEQFTAYAAIVKGIAVCQGYSCLFYRLALDSGVDARLVAGLGNGGNHAWNIVELNDKYYYLDSTWDEPRYKSKGSYEFFLKGSSNFPNHTPGGSQEGVTQYTPEELTELSTTDYPVPFQIIKQPQTAYAQEGQTVYFGVRAMGTNLQFTWYYRLPNQSSWNAFATQSTVSLTAADRYDGLQLYCTVTDGVTSEDTDIVTFHLGEQPFSISEQPVDTTATEGKTAELSVKAEGNGLSYQWQYYDVSAGKWINAGMDGSNTETMTVPATAENNGRRFRCVVTDSSGVEAVSDEAVLTVVGGHYVNYYMQGPEAGTWYTIYSDEFYIAEGETKQLRTSVGNYSKMTISWQWYDEDTKKWITDTGDWPSEFWGDGNESTSWITLNADEKLNNRKIRSIAEDSNGIISYGKELTIKVVGKNDAPVIVKQPWSLFLQAGYKADFDILAVGVDLTYQWYYKEANSSEWKAFEGATEPELEFYAEESLDGMKVRCKVTAGNGKSVVSDGESYLEIAGGMGFIVKQPESCTVTEGQIAEFSVETDGARDYGYIWQSRKDNSADWESIENADADYSNYGSTLRVVATKDIDSYQYRCIVLDDNWNKDFTHGVTLTVTSAAPSLAITTQPVNVSTEAGQNATFTVKATGKDLSYQWQYYTEANGAWKNSGMTGSTTDTITVPATVKRDGQKYRCIVTDSDDNSVISKAALLTVTSSLAITAQPKNTSVIEGSTAKFSVTATGNNLSYQWQYKMPDGSWKNCTSKTTGYNAATLKVSATATRNNYLYRCIVTDGNGGSVTSSSAKLTVISELAITSQPSNTTVNVGDTAKFTVKATGAGLTYQWQYYTAANGVWKNSGMTGSTTATISVPATDARNGQRYRCIVTDSGGNSIVSSAATLTVESSLAIVTQPNNITAYVGETAKFTVKASGTGLTYQWQYYTAANGIWKNSGMTGSTTATISVPVTEARNGQKYRCIVTDNNGDSVISNAAKLTVEASELEILVQPANQSGAVGDTVTFSVTAQGNGLTYQWQYYTAANGAWKDSGMTGNKTNKLSVPVTKARNGQRYRCLVTDASGESLLTRSATLTVK